MGVKSKHLVGKSNHLPEFHWISSGSKTVPNTQPREPSCARSTGGGLGGCGGPVTFPSPRLLTAESCGRGVCVYERGRSPSGRDPGCPKTTAACTGFFSPRGTHLTRCQVSAPPGPCRPRTLASVTAGSEGMTSLTSGPRPGLDRPPSLPKQSRGLV